jgi:cell division protein FtsB
MNSRWHIVLLPLALLASCVYFGYHFLQGERGLFFWIRLQKDIRIKKTILEKSQKDYEQVKQMVDLLGKNKVDLNLLEERSKAVLHYSKANEFLVRDKNI